MMATDKMDPAFLEPSKTPAQPELLVSAVLHLMSHYTTDLNETGVCINAAGRQRLLAHNDRAMGAGR
jgi:hypothetical protein